MINKSKFKSHKFKNNDDEFLFFGTQKSIEQNLENLNNIDISDKYYVQSGNQSDWSTCSILRELNETILTVDQNKDKGLPKINTIEENQDKFFINCSLMGIDNFFEEILKFKKRVQLKNGIKGLEIFQK